MSFIVPKTRTDLLPLICGQLFKSCELSRDPDSITSTSESTATNGITILLSTTRRSGLHFSSLGYNTPFSQKMIRFSFDVVFSVCKSLDIDMIFRVLFLRFVKGVNIPERVAGCHRDIKSILLLATAPTVKFELGRGNSPSPVILYDCGHLLVVLLAEFDLLEVRNNSLFLHTLWNNRVASVCSPCYQHLRGSRVQFLGNFTDNGMVC